MKNKEKVMALNIRCRCGERMLPDREEGIVDFKCPKMRVWNFLKHSSNQMMIVGKIDSSKL
jgi:phage FluMu protein Com